MTDQDARVQAIRELLAKHGINTSRLSDAQLASAVAEIDASHRQEIERHGWQPISSAPKDEPVLVYIPKGTGRATVRWDGYAWETCYGRYRVAPSHWMALPNAPNPRETRKEGV